MTRKSFLFVACAVAALFCSWAISISFGQGTSALITGTVRDNSQAVIAGAGVVVTNTETGSSRTAVSNIQGLYRLVDLQPGTYDVTVTMPGFETITQKGIVLQVGQEQTLNLVLQVGAVETKVEVTGEAPLVETTTAAMTTTISQEEMRQLPLNGRGFVDLATLNSATIAPTTQSVSGIGANSVSNGPQLSVAGARTDANSFTIDGTDIQPASHGTPGGASRNQLGVDTIREFQVVTSDAKAELGGAAGGFINAVSRSGTNDLHGSAYEFFRNSDLDSRSFFDTSLPPYKQNQFGATLGGPIKKDKTFFFIGYENLQERLSQNFGFTVPTASARQGVGFLTGTQTVAPDVVPFLNIYPLPQTPISATSGTYTELFYQPTHEQYGSVRIDQTFSSKDSLFGRMTFDDSSRVGELGLDASYNIDIENKYLTLQEDHIFSPTVLNMFRFGFNDQHNQGSPNDLAPDQGLSFGLGRPMGSLAIGSGFAGIGPNQTAYLHQGTATFQFEDNVTYTRGAHTLKFGAGLERFRWNTDQPNDQLGALSAANFPCFLQGGVGACLGGTTLQPGSVTYRHIRDTMPWFFAQDDYRVTQRLTLNLGLRWEFTTGLNEINGFTSFLAQGPFLSTAADLKQGSLWQNHIGLFDPRFGFNWGLDKSGKTDLSGGFGVYHSQLLSNMMIAERFQLPYVYRGNFSAIDGSAFFPNIYQMLAAYGQVGFTGTENREFDYYNFHAPVYYRANLQVQRELPGRMVLQLSYVLTTGFHEARNQQLNGYPQPATLPNGQLVFPCGTAGSQNPVPFAGCPNPALQFINPNFGSIPYMSSDANSVYHSISVTVKKSFSNGLQFQASYTNDRSVDDFSASDSNFNTSGRAGEWGPERSLDRGWSTFMVPQNFIFSGLYELPVGQGMKWMNSNRLADIVLGGWQIGGILTLQDGPPFTINCGTCTYPTNPFATTYPELTPGYDLNTLRSSAGVPSNVLGPAGPTSQYFQVAGAFLVPAAGTLGDSIRSTMLGPGLANVDASFSKTFSLTERFKLQWRNEFFNFFNHTDFGVPGSSAFSNVNGTVNATAGRLQAPTAQPGRQIQFALKLTF